MRRVPGRSRFTTLHNSWQCGPCTRMPDISAARSVAHCSSLVATEAGPQATLAQSDFARGGGATPAAATRTAAFVAIVSRKPLRARGRPARVKLTSESYACGRTGERGRVGGAERRHGRGRCRAMGGSIGATCRRWPGRRVCGVGALCKRAASGRGAPRSRGGRARGGAPWRRRRERAGQPPQQQAAGAARGRSECRAARRHRSRAGRPSRWSGR